MSGQRIQVLERAVDIIDVLSSGPQTLTEVAQRTGLAKGTVFRILQGLSYGALVVKDPGDHRYLPGPGLWRFGQNAVDEAGMMSALASPSLNQLRDTTQETITLSTRIGLDRVCVAELPSPLPLLYQTKVGSRVPLHIGASGRTLLAYTPEPKLERLIDHLSSSAMDDYDVADPAELKRSLEEIREKGWAMSVGERLPGAAGVVVPVQSDRHPVMTISVLGPESRMPRESLPDLVPAMQKVAAQVERRISSV